MCPPRKTHERQHNFPLMVSHQDVSGGQSMPTCKKLYGIEEFPKRHSGKQQRRWECRRCRSARKKEAYKPKVWDWHSERHHQALIPLYWRKERTGRQITLFPTGIYRMCNECHEEPGGWYGSGKCRDCARRYARELEREKLRRDPLLRERKMAQLAQWKRDNPGRDRASKRKHNQELYELEGNDLTGDEWRSIMKAFDWCCVYCGRRSRSKTGNLQRDHIVPFSEGGKFTKGNIVPACAPCNQKKGTQDFEKFIASGEKYETVMNTLIELAA